MADSASEAAAAPSVPLRAPRRRRREHTAHTLRQKVGKLEARKSDIKAKLFVARSALAAREWAEAAARRKTELKKEFFPRSTAAQVAGEVEALFAKLQPGKIYFTCAENDKPMDAIRLTSSCYSEEDLPEVTFWEVVAHPATTDGSKKVHVRRLSAYVDQDAFETGAFKWRYKGFAAGERPDNVKCLVVWTMYYTLGIGYDDDNVHRIPYEDLHERAPGKSSVKIKFTKRRTFEYWDAPPAWASEMGSDYDSDEKDDSKREDAYDYPDGHYY
jgi:hypothetical protein